jgi:hypothetical protein
MSKEPRDFVQTLSKNRRGLIAAPKRPDRAMLVMFAIRAFSQAGITIVTASRSEAKWWVQYLRQRVRERVDYHTGAYIISDARVRVATFHSVDPSRSDFLFFVNAGDALTAAGIELSMLLRNQHVYGFVDPAEERSPRDRIGLEGVFGPIRYQMPELKGTPAQVRVMFVNMPLLPDRSRDRGLERKRSAVWHNDARNKVVTDVADALARGDHEMLWRQGIFLGEADANGSAAARKRSVALLVESPEHGRECLRRLPGWILKTWNGNRENGTPLEQNPRAPTRPRPIGLILTMASAQFDPDALCEIEVLVRADAGSGGLNLRGFPPRAVTGRPDEILVVDFDDDGDARAQTSTAHRVRDYRARGWDVAARCLHR